eukprot:389952-Prorocentrum_minimum.AAC.1
MVRRRVRQALPSTTVCAHVASLPLDLSVAHLVPFLEAQHELVVAAGAEAEALERDGNPLHEVGGAHARQLAHGALQQRARGGLQRQVQVDHVLQPPVEVAAGGQVRLQLAPR